MFDNIDILKNYEKFNEKQLCHILFPEPPACNSIKKEAPAQGFSGILLIFRNFYEHLFPHSWKCTSDVFAIAKKEAPAQGFSGILWIFRNFYEQLF